MSDKPLPRPRQVTFAAWLVIGGSVLIVLMAYDAVSTLRSLETRDSVRELLQEPPLDGLGLSIESALRIIQGFATVAAACAVVTAVLGYQTLQRSRSARLWATLAAVPPFLTGFFGLSWGMVSAVVLAAATMLWMQPARNWFKGLPPPEGFGELRQRRESEQRERERVSAGVAPSYHVPDPSQRREGPTPYAGFGQAGPRPWQATPSRDRRPGPVIAAATVTWLGTGITLAVMAAVVGLAIGAPDLVWEEAARTQPDLVEEAGLTQESMRRMMLLGAGICAVWAVLAAVLAVFVWRRAGWARYALLLSAGGVAGLSLLGLVNSLLMIVPFGLAMSAAYLLLHPQTRDWFAGD